MMLQKTQPTRNKNILKKCKCGTEFKQYNSIHNRCIPCMIANGKKLEQRNKIQEQKEFRAETRRRKNKIKKRSKWLKEAQDACNAYIRERDKDQGCISCGTQKPNVQYAAGHYKTRGGSPELRFHPMNIHKQCNQYCNKQLSANIVNYRPNLIKKIGLKNVEWLEGEHKLQKLTIDDIKEIKAYYKEQTKILKNKPFDDWCEGLG